MKTKTFILLSLLICNLLPAQNVKLDIKPHFLGVRADSLFVSMDISVEIEDMNPKKRRHTDPHSNRARPENIITGHTTER